MYYYSYSILILFFYIQVIGNWLKYAQWEESQKQIQRARSIYERALDVDHRNVTLWYVKNNYNLFEIYKLQVIEKKLTELKNKTVNF